TFLKRKPWEESVRVPGILRWPAGFRGGWKSDAPFSHVDVVPTLLGLAGAGRRLSGFDYSNLLRGRNRRTPEYAHLAIHTRTELNEFGPWRGVRTRRYKYARFREKPWLLHDLERDPFEMENLAAARPDVVSRFDREIERHMRRTGDRWDELGDRPFR
ncbi:MAG: sulfatase family protein, partial [Bryobacteraceae bacterium]